MLVIVKRIIDGIHYYIAESAAEEFDNSSSAQQMRLALLIIDEQSFFIFKNVLLKMTNTCIIPSIADRSIQQLDPSRIQLKT